MNKTPARQSHYAERVQTPTLLRSSFRSPRKSPRRSQGSVWIDHWADASALPGTWVFIPLIAGSGDLPDAVRSERERGPRSTTILAELPHIGNIIRAFQTKVLRARLMKLKAGADIKQHRDFAYFGGQRWSFERGRIRVHIPIITGANVFWMLNGKRIDMKAGEAWYVNACMPHSAENRGDTDRIHLVLELEVNDWVRSVFPPESFRSERFTAISAVALFSNRRR